MLNGADINVSPEQAMLAAMHSAGVGPSKTTALAGDGNIHRYHVSGDNRGTTNGWYVLHTDGVPAGAFGCFKRQVTQTWCAKAQKEMSAKEIAEMDRRMERAKQMREEAKQTKVGKAIEDYHAAQETGACSYFEDKGITGLEGVRYEQPDTAVIPAFNTQGKITGISRITGKKKRFHGEKTGSFYLIKEGDPDLTLILITEGYDTGYKVNRIAGYPVAVAFDAGNLGPVCDALDSAYPGCRLLICADDDWQTPGNTGITYAKKTGRPFVVPQFPPDCTRTEKDTDFSDLARLAGDDTVRSQIQAAVKACIDAAAPLALPEPESLDFGYEWPDLIPLDACTPPPIPQVLPDWAGQYAKELAWASETPPELAMVMTLACCAAITARVARLRVYGDHYEPLNLWLACALPPGNRKSFIHSAVTRALIEWEQEQSERIAPTIKTTESEQETLRTIARELRSQASKTKDAAARQELIAEVAQLEAAAPETPTIPRLWTSDATPERMGTLLSENGECMAMLSSEGGLMDNFAGRYSAGMANLDLLLKGWSGDPERVDRGSRPPVFLKYPRITLGLTPQPSTVQGLAATAGFVARGLVGRIIFAMPPSPLGYRTLEPRSVNPTTRQTYDAAIRAMLAWETEIDDNGNPRLRLIRLSKEAHATWLEFARYVEVSMQPGQPFERITDWAGKAAGQAARLAGLFHCIKYAHGEPWRFEVDAETMDAALEFMVPAMSHALAAYALMGADESIAAAQTVWAWITKNKKPLFEARQGQRALQGSFPHAEQYHAALKLLEERGYIVVDKIDKPQGSRGRPKLSVEVRPELCKGWTL